MKIIDIISYLESVAPLSYQEPYDNSGLLVGSKGNNATGALLTIDVTEEIIDEAIKKKLNLVIAHHPVIFSGLKKLTGANSIERVVMKAIKHDIAIYAGHTNFDSVATGVNKKICDKIGLKNCSVLSPVSGGLKKLVYFVPTDHAEKVRQAIFEAGAGHIGNYDCCSYNLEGKGSFRAGEGASPFVGNIGKIHYEEEVRTETVFPKARQAEIISALLKTHPYEEVAFDIYPLDNKYPGAGMGMVGNLEKEEDALKFLKRIKKVFECGSVRHTAIIRKSVKRVALCGGSGSSMIGDAIRSKADIFITGDVKYHGFFDAENRIIIADIGHYESEQFTKEIFYDLLIKKFPTFAVNFSEINTNPIKYL